MGYNKNNKEKDYDKPHSIRMDDEAWKLLNMMKTDGKSWNVFIKDLYKVIDFIKNLGKFV